MHHLDANLVPDYCPLDEHIGVGEERRTFVRALLFCAEQPKPIEGGII